MKNGFALTTALLACLPMTGAAGNKLPDGARRLEPTQLALTIGADGRAAAIRCVSENARRLCSLLTRAVSTWSFEPGRRDEVPTAVDVFMDLTLVAVPEQSGFAVRAIDAELTLRGASEQGIPPFVPPQYPPQSQIRGDTGRVELELIIEPGRRTYRVGRAWFGGKEQTDRRNPLVEASVRAAERQPVRSPPPELLAECVEYVFTLQPGPEPKTRDKACQDTHVPGFAAPRIVTDVTAARF